MLHVRKGHYLFKFYSYIPKNKFVFFIFWNLFKCGLYQYFRNVHECVRVCCFVDVIDSKSIFQKDSALFAKKKLQ